VVEHGPFFPFVDFVTKNGLLWKTIVNYDSLFFTPFSKKDFLGLDRKE